MSDPAINRREFAKAAGVGTAAVLLPGGVSAEKRQSPAPVEAPKPTLEQPPSQADLLLDVIRQRYPDRRLTPGVLGEIYRDLRHYVRRGRSLSSYPLKNSDEPAFVFAAYRKR